MHIASVLRFQVLHGVQCTLRCLNGSSNVQILKHAGSVSCSECLPLVTTITFINIIVFGIELCLSLPNSHTLFLIIWHFRSLNKTKDFYVAFPSDSSSKLFNKCLTIPPLPSLHFPPFIQSPYHNLLSTHNHPITTCCQHTITLSQSAVNTQSNLM